MNTTNQTTVETVRPLNSIAELYAFKGEVLLKVGDTTNAEAIRYGVNLINTGSETQARGVFVLADKLRSQPDDTAKGNFREAIKSEMVTEAKEKAVLLMGPNAKAKDIEKAKEMAVAEATKRFDNLGQTLRAAKWMLENPKKVADSVSVFTVQQVNAYLEAPKEGSAGAVEKLAVQKAVLPLLLKPGTSQGAIKAAVSAEKERIAKAKEPVDNRTEAQKKDEAQTATIARLASRVELIAKDIDGLVTDGRKIEEIRSEQFAAAVKALATLAGLTLK